MASHGQPIYSRSSLHFFVDILPYQITNLPSNRIDLTSFYFPCRYKGIYILSDFNVQAPTPGGPGHVFSFSSATHPKPKQALTASQQETLPRIAQVQRSPQAMPYGIGHAMSCRGPCFGGIKNSWKYLLTNSFNLLY